LPPPHPKKGEKKFVFFTIIKGSKVRPRLLNMSVFGWGFQMSGVTIGSLKQQNTPPAQLSAQPSKNKTPPKKLGRKLLSRVGPKPKTMFETTENVVTPPYPWGCHKTPAR